MGFSKSSIFSITLLLLTSFCLLIPPNTAVDLSNLVYKGCARQNFPDNSFQATLTGLFNSLLAQASTAKFFKTTAGNGQNAVSGLFQCRGDLANGDCYNCVKKLPEMASSLCGGQPIAARIHLTGCYLVYQTSAFPQVSGTEILYKMCSSKHASFEEKRDTAFNYLETGIAGGSGFYATTYANVYAVAQCQGDLSTSDCGECVKEAIQKAEVECGNSVAGQVYLSRCYMSYSYLPEVGRFGHSSGSGRQTGKTVAIVVGGAAALGFGVIFLLFVRSLFKKKEDY